MQNLVAITASETKIAAIVGPEIAKMGYELVRVRISGGQHMSLQIMAERKQGGMEIDDCANVSKAISAILDLEDPISDAYTLEVSSPGINRPLTRLIDFETWQGHIAKIELVEPLNGQKRFKGIIDKVNGSSISIRNDHLKTEIEFCSIANAKLVITNSLLNATSKLNPSLN